MLEKIYKLKAADKDFRLFEFDRSEIGRVEEQTSLVFPDYLKSLWQEFGYFFMDRGLNNEKMTYQLNRLLTPEEIAQLLNGDTDLDFQDPKIDRVDNSIPFMAGSRDSCLHTSIDDTGVFWIGDRVSETLGEFFNRLADDAGFYTG